MICEPLWTMFSLGFDSFVAGVAIGHVLMSWRERAFWSFLFGGCDAITTLLGSSLPHRLPELPAGLLYLFCIALAVQAARCSRAWLFALPLLLGLDNFVTATQAVEAPALAISSAIMAMAGLTLGAFGWRRVAKVAA